MCKQFKEHISAIIIISIFITTSIIQAQVDTLWTKTFGGDDYDSGLSIQQTTDGGYILAGVTSSFGAGEQDAWLIKINAFGDTLWTKTYGGNDADWGRWVQQTIDGGYIVSGHTSSFGAGLSDVWLIKTDNCGDTIWTKTYGYNEVEYSFSVQQTRDAGYIMAGVKSVTGAYNDVWLIKTDEYGDTLWTKTFGGNGNDQSYTVQQTGDAGYIIIGETTSFGAGDYDIWLIKTNASGDTLWTKTFGGPGMDSGRSARQTIDEGYIVTGSFDITIATEHNRDLYLIKTNGSGDILWTKIYGGSGGEHGLRVEQTSDEGYIISGYTNSLGLGDYDIWLIKTDASGDTLWTRTFGGYRDDFSLSLQRTADGGYIIAGDTYPIGAESSDVWLIKTTPDVTTIEKTKINTPSEYTLSQNFPNPFNPKTTFEYYIPKSDRVTIFIYTVSGQIVDSKTMNLNPGSYSYEFDGTKYSSGIYFYKISTSSGFSAGQKMVLLK